MRPDSRTIEDATSRLALRSKFTNNLHLNPLYANPALRLLVVDVVAVEVARARNNNSPFALEPHPVTCGAISIQ
jgi:hypothetical protein